MATTNTDDLRIDRIDPLISPAVLSYQLPLSESAAQLVASARKGAEAILKGEDDRLLVVVGPCSIHDPSAAIEYAMRLKEAAAIYQKDLHIIMRVYFEKPRTTVGWKGLINDPNLNDSFDINQGLRTARELLLQLAEMGVPAGTEFLDAISPQYVADLIAWGAIGARTTESQVHRELASGLSMPVGFKNGTGGSIQIALDAIGASSKPHHFLSVTKQGVSAIVTTAGNDACHLILRGEVRPVKITLAMKSIQLAQNSAKSIFPSNSWSIVPMATPTRTSVINLGLPQIFANKWQMEPKTSPPL